MSHSDAAVGRGHTTSRQRFEDTLSLGRCARTQPGEVLKFICRSQLREFTTTSMERGHDPPEDGLPGKEGSAQSLSVAMKQRLATDDASQGTSETAQQDA